MATTIKDDDVMVTYGLAAALAPYAAEGMLGASWTDMQHACDPTLSLVQRGRLSVAQRHRPPSTQSSIWAAPTPSVSFPIGDPEAGRQAEPD